jgi:hypothetical protein
MRKKIKSLIDPKTDLNKIKGVFFYYCQDNSIIDNPIFIIGCGRSGTTILGRSLAIHPDIAYLNEPRKMWFAAYPQTDIWSYLAPKRKGRLFLDESDINKQSTGILKTLFAQAINQQGGILLCEKLPENCFRIKFLRALFPNACFLHIIRNGIDVAHSIQKNPNWYGMNDYKWQALKEYAQTQHNYRKLLPYCHSNFERGLLEWRMSVEVVQETLKKIPDSDYLKIYYESFIKNPFNVMESIQHFSNLSNSSDLTQFIQKNIKHKISQFNVNTLTSNQQKICLNLMQELEYA